MDSGDWLMSVEKLQVVQCNNREKVLLASQQLPDPTSDWWDAYMEAHGEPKASTSRSSELLSMHIMFPWE
jgi:hypothetical protein